MVHKLFIPGDQIIPGHALRWFGDKSRATIALRVDVIARHPGEVSGLLELAHRLSHAAHIKARQGGDRRVARPRVALLGIDVTQDHPEHGTLSFGDDARTVGVRL